MTAALATALALATLIALYLGLLGLTGALHWTRCERCGHLLVSATSTARNDCRYCRHDRLLHPLHTIRHPHDPARLGPAGGH